MRKKCGNKFFIAAVLITASMVQCYVFGKIVMIWHGSNRVALSYLDPSTGAMIISAILGIFATILLGIKTFWYKIVSLFRHKSKGAKRNQDKR